MKKMIMYALMFNAVQPLAAANVEAVMYLDTEMPCLTFEKLSGKIIIRNNGDDEIKLMARPDFPEMVFCFQCFVFADISVEEEKRMTARPAESPIIRQRIKNGIDHVVRNNEDIVTLKKGESWEADFKENEIKVPHGAFDRRLPFVVELYLSPDTWVPVKVHPPIVVACGAKFTSLSDAEAGDDREAARVVRVQIGTNEFLWARARSATRSERLADLRPDDVVTHSNKVITITRKDGTVRTIPEADIARVSAERKEAIRKNWPKEGNTP